MKKPMEIDSPDASKRSICGNQENGLHLYPVSTYASGEGLPYAPIDWPNPGDRWAWKVGRRIAASGHFLDRYLYPPKHLLDRRGRRKGLASRQSVEQYIRTTFPDADVNAFFASFSWKIPSEKPSAVQDSKEDVPLEELAEPSVPNSQIGVLACKAGNKACCSSEVGNSPSRFMPCDICCNEPGFCRDCCCILCCKTISPVYGGYSYIRCEALIGGYICGHIAHINCGLRAYLAGTIGGSIGLDAEYYCRRCDSRSDLVSHVEKLLKTCEFIGSRDDIEEILEVGMCILRGSQRESAKQLLHYISLAMAKLKNGADLEDVWKEEDCFIVKAGGPSHGENGDLVLTGHKDPPTRKAISPTTFPSEFDYRLESLLLEDEIADILLALKKSQESEYKIAVEALTAQKNFIQDLYKQLGYERSEFSRNTSSTDADADALQDCVRSRVDQIKREIQKLEDMKVVAKGFGRTSKRILKEHFGLETEKS